ncbi:MAG: E3 binding domain-containing protein, partial [Gammaproteobacteria bacterium]|nr:E3 binding domain-containing protein [Gammaproteobacteria bacterium]
MAETIDIIIPDLGDFSDVEVIEVLVKKGDRVSREDGLITLETDKASLDVPAPNHGVIESISVAVGDKVSAGDVIGRLAIEVGDTVVVTPAIEAEVNQGDTTVLAVPASPQATHGLQTVSVPDIGDFSDVDVIEVHVAAGDKIKVNDSLITLETDKATMDVPSEVAGTVDSVLLKVGDSVSKGTPVAVINAIAGEEKPPAAPAPETVPEAATVQEKPAPAAATTAAPPVAKAGAPKTLPAINEAGFSKAHASPSVRKLARELGVDLVQVKGSGPKQRILHDDVKAFVKSILSGGATLGGGGLPKVPVVDFAKFGAVESQPLTRIQKISGPRLQASWINLPHVTQHDLADITELEAKRQAL